MGLPDTSRTLSAAPPRASPSILVRMAPLMSTWSLNALTRPAASCPVMASTTSSVSVGRMAALMLRSSPIMSASTCSRPAVSTITASTLRARASATPARAMSTGLAPVPISNTGTSMALPSFCSWSMAAGRYTSVATIITLFFCLSRYSASLPHAVVLPTPCRPAMRMTWGKPWLRSLDPLLPISSTSSSATTLTNWVSGLTPSITFCPSAFSSTFLMNLRTTGKLTSASRSARRISLSGSLMFSEVSLSLLPIILRARSMLRLSESNIAARVWTTRPARPLQTRTGPDAVKGANATARTGRLHTFRCAIRPLPRACMTPGLGH
mmetsp:Transcript_25133/g.63754  ORF Transcript_25133/g.63754 Transcript_25133/m.63754 type:complete len:324 (-) Transcript_25133:60-1031(-)